MNHEEGAQFIQLQIFDVAANLTAVRGNACNHPRARRIPEVVETRKFVWVASHAVKDLAFLFYVDESADSVFSVQGMSRAFLLRYDLDGKELKRTNRFPDDCKQFLCGQS